MVGAWQLPRAGTVENPLRIAIFISGSGSGMEALLIHQKRDEILHKTVIVICDKADAEGITKAQNLGAQIEVIEVPMHAESQQRRIMHEEKIQAVLDKHAVEAVILSGYMRILTPSFVRIWSGRIINIHPSLLPDFPGAHAHRDVIEAGSKVTGCTIHLVDDGVDSGPIIVQRKIHVLPNDDENTLQKRVKEIEHKLYPETIDKLCSGDVIS